MKPAWFKDSIPLDPLIAPMVVFFQENRIETWASCEGGNGHLCGRPTITFKATSIKEIEAVASLLQKNDLDTGCEIGLMRGFFTQKPEFAKGYGLVQWIWTNEGKTNYYIRDVYDRVIQMVDMKKVADITMDWKTYKKRNYKFYNEDKDYEQET